MILHLYELEFVQVKILSAPERSEGAEVFNKPVRDADVKSDPLGGSEAFASVCLSVCYVPY